MFTKFWVPLALLIFFQTSAQAFTCQTSDGNIIPPRGSETPVKVYVNIGPDLIDGKNEIINVSQISCKNDVRAWHDYLKTDNDAMILNTYIFKNIMTGLQINDMYHQYPIPSGLEILDLNNGQSAPLNMKMFIDLKKQPNSDIHIRKGDFIAQINLIQSNNQSNCPYCGPYKWILVANNDANFVTTTCTINNNEQKNVEFGQVRQDLLTTDAYSSMYKKEEALYYSCDDKTVSEKIRVRLVSDTAPFSTQLIRTSNPRVGVALLFNNKVIAPEEAIETSVTSGEGQDNIQFALVKDDKTYSSIPTGSLSGSATLIFSSP
ncbi:TPA: fimbrial protein [Enterobacter roggenkampii]|nr:fimbrial protein [Enterobacter roggenkampii]